MIPPLPFSPQCCDQKNEVTSDMVCRMLPEIVERYRYLCDRHNQLMSGKRKRIQGLAEPVEVREKYSYPCFCRDGEKRKVEILRMDKRACTRTEQLAYPSVSKKRAKWSYEEWLVHNSYMLLLSKPKQLPERRKSEEVRKSRVLKDMKRTNRLAKPKTYVETARNEWHLTNSLKNYVPSKRIEKLAKETRPQPRPYDGFQVKPEALTYIPSQRIKELAVAPAHRYKKEVKALLAFYSTQPKALTYKASQRIIDLSKPRESSDKTQITDPYRVKRSALNFKITERLAEMAKPKTYSR